MCEVCHEWCEMHIFSKGPYIHVSPPQPDKGETLDNHCRRNRVDAWGAKILAAVHRKDQRLAGGAPTSCSPLSHSLDKNEKHSDDDQVEVEMSSRNDSLRTCVTGADAILSWPIFPSEKPVSIFGTSAFSAKRDRFTPGSSRDHFDISSRCSFVTNELRC